MPPPNSATGPTRRAGPVVVEPTDRIRCMAQALLSGGQWKTCIREVGHPERHVWLEAYNVVGRRPIVVTWHGTRSTAPMVAEVIVPEVPRG